MIGNEGVILHSVKQIHNFYFDWAFPDKFVDFFLMWCHKLESLLLKAEVGFLTDQYLDSLLAANPLKEAKYIVIASDEFVSN